MSEGGCSSLNRPFYTVIRTVEGIAIDPEMAITVWDDVPGKLEGPKLWLKSEYTEIQKHKTQIDMIFKAPCSQVSFWARVRHRNQNSHPNAVSKVVALSKSSHEVANCDFTTYPNGSVVLVTLGLLGQPVIKSLRFNLDPGPMSGAVYADEWLFVDNIVMAR